MKIIKWNLYKVQEFDDNGNPRSGLFTVHAPSKGVAIEVFLACCGILSYQKVKCSKVNKLEGEFISRKETSKIMQGIEYESMQELDIHHVWEEW